MNSSNDSDGNSKEYVSKLRKNKLSHCEEQINSSFMKHIPPPNPILPKSINSLYEPPKCPLKMINFMYPIFITPNLAN